MESAAAWTFSQALDKEPGDPKAFKGLLRVADHHLEKAKAPVEAVRVYRYLLGPAAVMLLSAALLSSLWYTLF